MVDRPTSSGPEQPEQVPGQSTQMPARSARAVPEPAGGESACLLALVCAECGALAEQAPPTTCWRCGALVERQ